MAPDHASRDRVAALGASSPASIDPPERGRARPPTGPSGPEEHPDPEFWGAQPRRVRATRRVDPDPRVVAAWRTGLVDRVRDARMEVGIGVVVVVVAALVAGVVWYRMGAAGSAPPVTPGSGGHRTSTTAAGHRGPTVVVHVAGAVVRPGVLLMPEGARVIDAVEGAGGATPEADLDRINLAARLVDGQRILVAKIGATAVVDPGGVADPAADPGALVDLNAATSAQLETLPGIGPALAGAIIAERDRRGGFRSINELREVRGIGEARFADLRARVTV